MEHLEKDNESALPSGPLPMCIATREGRILVANPRWRATFGSGQHVTEAARAPEASTLDNLWAQRLQALEKGSVHLHVSTGPPPQLTWWRWLIEQAGEDRVRVCAQDVTAERRLMAVLKVRERSSSLEALTRGLVHELNNPLSSIITNLTFLQQQVSAGPLDEDALPDVEGALADAAEATQLVRSIVLGLGDLVSAPAAPSMLQLNDLLNAVVNMCRAAILNRAQLVLDLSSEVPPVWAVRADLAQVVMTLILQAVESLPEGHAVHHQITVRSYAGPNGCARVEVRDTGPGLTAQEQQSLFSLSAGEDSLGTLWSAKQILDDLGGRLSLESEPGRGSIVLLELPGTPASEEAKAAGGGEPPPQRRVLIVEDDKLVAGSLRRVLADYDVRVAHGGREAARILIHETFEVILCDLMMPDITGMELYELIEQDRPELCERFVFLTGGAFTDHARAFLQERANPTLCKPFEPDALVALVRKRLGAARGGG